mgnify:CR=1 FL=1
MAKSTILNSVEEVIEDFRNGRIVIVVDDEDRENEGDFIVAAEKITPEIVNFMLKEGRGVLCAPLSEERCAELGLNMMEENNTSLLGTPFTVTVDLLGNGCTTGVSIHDRGATIRALADPAPRATDLGRPGHINPLRYRGYYYDRETRLYYLQSRYYDFANCRFINADGQLSVGVVSQNGYIQFLP